MTNKCQKYSSEQISLFVDNELPENESDAIEAHQKECPHCQELIEQYQTMSTLFDAHTQEAVSTFNTQALKEKLSSVSTPKEENTWAWGTFFTKNIYLKLASIAAILIISLVAFQERLIAPEGPNAIIESVEVSNGSVMIIETEEQQAVIWFNEA